MPLFRKILSLFQPASPKDEPTPSGTVSKNSELPPPLTSTPVSTSAAAPESGRWVTASEWSTDEEIWPETPDVRPISKSTFEPPARFSEEAEVPDADDRDPLRSALIRLRDESVWSVLQAKAILGPLEPLAATQMIIVAASAMGPIVCLGREGRRAVQGGTYKSFSVEGYENLLYFRVAAQHYHWRVEREQPFRGRRSMGYLDQLGVVGTPEGRRYVMARVTAGGYDARTVAATFNRMRTTLIAYNSALLVITPDRGKIGRMHSRQGMLEIQELKIK